jgi:PAS domain-containing protein
MSVLSNKKQVSAETPVINDHTDGSISSKPDISENEAAVLTFYDNGMIGDCNQRAEELLDCSTRELTGQPISRLFPELAKIMLVHGKRANSCLHFLSRIGHRFDVVSMSGTHFESELFFNDMEYLGRHYFRTIINPTRQKGV